MQIKLKFEHWLSITGFVLITLFILSINKVLPPSGITDILSSKYSMYFACLLVGVGYFISKIQTEDEVKPTDNFAPGLGEKKHIISDKPVDTNLTDFGGGGD